MLYFNKYAGYKYESYKEYEAGLSLTGAQVKEIRAGKFNLKECNVRFDKGELWVSHTGLQEDKVKLLLTRTELYRISLYLDEKRHHVYAIGIFQKGRFLKMKIGTGVVKKQYQKTEQQKRKDVKINMSRALREKNFDF